VAEHWNTRLSIWSVTSNHHHHQAIYQISVDNDVRGVCVDLNGLVYVSCGRVIGKHVVEIREPRMGFRVLHTLGREDELMGNGVGEFYFPSGMSVDANNTLMVVDKGNHRIQFFD
jgi:hypothetical protein